MGNEILNIGGFEIEKRLGTGARSTIYLAIDLVTKTQVALKRVIYDKPEDARIFEQVETEYKIANKIDHPYVRKCYKLKKIRSLLRVRELLLSMELFEGQSLEEGHVLSLGDILLVFRAVATGLSAMHQAGYVHCDIKPNNILLNKSASIKIIDLGQSCKIGTVKERIQGTPDYIAPEQVKRKPLGPKTDIFNLGATMYWALTGKNIPTLIPKKDSLGFIIPQHRKAPHEITKQLPVSLSKLVMDCVEDEPLERPKSMMEVISRLDIIVHHILGDKIKAKRNGT